MKLAFPLALSLAFGVLALPAHAQTMPGMSGGGMGGAGGGPKIQPKLQAPDLAPSGLPGVGGVAPLATGQNLQKPNSDDPTQELFKAINSNDYGAAQDAVSRGANLQATNQFGETPLDLAVALNRNDITFLLLGTRNELAAQGAGAGSVMGAPWALDNTAKPAKKGRGHSSSSVVPVKVVPQVGATVGEPGTPDPQAGFLGFSPKG